MMKSLFITFAVLAVTSTASASSYYAYQMECKGGLASTNKASQATTRTVVTAKFCVAEIGWQNMDGTLGGKTEYIACEPNGEAGISYTGVRSNGTSYKGFIETVNATPVQHPEEGITYRVDSCDYDGKACAEDEVYFELNYFGDSPGGNQYMRIVDNPNNRDFEFSKAKCIHTEI